MPDSSEPSIPIAAIAACASVGGLVAIFLAFRVGLCIYRRRRHKPAPLPPPRPLTALQTLPWNANSSTNTSTYNYSSSKVDLSSPISASPSGYYPEPAMMQRGDPTGRAGDMYRHYSGSTLNTEEMPLQPPSPITRTSSPLADGQLVPPQPSFFSSQGMNSNRSSAQLSLNSSTEESDIASYPPQRHQSVTAFPADPLLDDPTNGSPTGTPHPPNPSPRMAAGVSARRLSVTGSISTIHTSRSTRSVRTQSTVRGPPHKSHSRVEVVLPAPLAPQPQHNPSYLHDFDEKNNIAGYTMSTLPTACDPWIKVGRENTASGYNFPPVPSRAGERRHRTVSSESQSAPPRRQARRPSASSISSLPVTNSYPSTPPNPNIYPSRSSSSSPSRGTRNKASLDLSDLPPVPRVPSMYTVSPASSSPSSPALAISDSITGNGKLRGLQSDPAISNKALPSNPSPNTVEEGG